MHQTFDQSKTKTSLAKAWEKYGGKTILVLCSLFPITVQPRQSRKFVGLRMGKSSSCARARKMKTEDWLGKL